MSGSGTSCSPNQPTALAAAAGCTLEDNVAQVRAAGNLEDRPLIVLTSPKQFDYDDPAQTKEASVFFEIWVHQLQPQLAHLSTRGRQVVVPDASFGIPYEEPEAVVQAVREVVTEVRAARH